MAEEDFPDEDLPDYLNPEVKWDYYHLIRRVKMGWMKLDEKHRADIGESNIKYYIDDKYIPTKELWREFITYKKVHHPRWRNTFNNYKQFIDQRAIKIAEIDPRAENESDIDHSPDDSEEPVGSGGGGLQEFDLPVYLDDSRQAEWDGDNLRLRVRHGWMDSDSAQNWFENRGSVPVWIDDSLIPNKETWREFVKWVSQSRKSRSKDYSTYKRFMSEVYSRQHKCQKRSKKEGFGELLEQEEDRSISVADAREHVGSEPSHRASSLTCLARWNDFQPGGEHASTYEVDEFDAYFFDACVELQDRAQRMGYDLKTPKQIVYMERHDVADWLLEASLIMPEVLKPIAERLLHDVFIMYRCYLWSMKAPVWTSYMIFMWMEISSGFDQSGDLNSRVARLIDTGHHSLIQLRFIRVFNACEKADLAKWSQVTGLHQDSFVSRCVKALQFLHEQKPISLNKTLLERKCIEAIEPKLSELYLQYHRYLPPAQKYLTLNIAKKAEFLIKVQIDWSLKNWTTKGRSDLQWMILLSQCYFDVIQSRHSYSSTPWWK